MSSASNQISGTSIKSQPGNLAARDANVADSKPSISFIDRANARAAIRATHPGGAKTVMSPEAKKALDRLQDISNKIDKSDFFAKLTQLDVLNTFDRLIAKARPALLNDPEKSDLLGKCLENLPVPYGDDAAKRAQTCFALAERADRTIAARLSSRQILRNRQRPACC